MAKCSICGNPAIAYVPYQKRYYCSKHYAEFVESKVERTVRRYKLIQSGDRVVAAVSGGKDSATLLSTLASLRDKLDYELIAFHIDLGIGEYSKDSREVVQVLAKQLRVPLIIFDLDRELGFTIPSAASKLRRPACSVCGIVKRYLYNAIGIELDAKVATGHNADDIIAFALKNFIVQDLESIRKLGPYTEGIPGKAAPRIRPLYDLYEKESFLYVLARKLPFVHRDCPYVRFTSLEFRLKEVVNKLEEEKPTLKLGFLRKLAERVDDYPSMRGEASECRYCGLLSKGDTCSFCKLTLKVKGEAMGSFVRERIRDLISRVL